MQSKEYIIIIFKINALNKVKDSEDIKDKSI
jgi:hypothetical protein